MGLRKPNDGSKFRIGVQIANGLELVYQGAAWLPAEQPNFTAVSTAEIYIFDEYLSQRVEALPVLLRQYQKPYPGKQLLIEIRNLGVESIELSEVKREEIPPELRDVRGLMAKLKQVGD
jgi:hypothetical protein